MVERLFLAVPRGYLQFVIVVFSDHTHLLFLRVDKSSCLPKLKSITVLLYDFTTKNKKKIFFHLIFDLQPKDFSQVLSTAIKLISCSILHFEMYSNSLNVECRI